ncbi:MAG: ParB/RepB/Spo0J family partition protein [Myxococcota bacterium]|nr:ParB/RepB/Spo0J family partition protein [Myxococcota bacterium]
MAVQRRKTLGRGLASLIPEASRSELGSPRSAMAVAGIVQVPMEEVRANPLQPRRHFGEEPLAELAASIREQGVIQPLLLRPVEGGYEIVAGERRFRAAGLAGLRTVPGIVRRMDDAESLEIALIENLQREDLNAVEEAEAYRDLIEEHGYTQEELSRRMGKDRSTISNMLRLLKLPDEALDALARGGIAMGHGRALLGLAELGEDAVLEVLARIVGDALSVRQTEDLVRRTKKGRRTRTTVKELPSALVDLQDRVARQLGTRVKVKPRARGEGGKIVLEYYTRQDLDRLVERIEGEVF